MSDLEYYRGFSDGVVAARKSLGIAHLSTEEIAKVYGFGYVTDDANDDSTPESDVSGVDVDVTTGKRSKTEHDGVTKTPDLLHDSQDKLYEDANSLCVELWNSDALSGWNTANMLKRRIIALLDRQRAITERECRESETFRAGIVRDAAANGETVYVFGVPYVPEFNYDKLKRRMESTRRAITKAGCLFTEENGAIAVVLPPDPNKQPDDYRSAYHRACHERDELRETLSRLLGLCDEMQRVASFYGQSVPYGAPDGCDEGLA